MAVTPQEARQLNADEDRRAVDRLEHMIDAYLRKNYDGDEMSMNVDYPKTKVFRELKERYQSAGWDIRLKIDQREGSYLILSERRK